MYPFRMYPYGPVHPFPAQCVHGVDWDKPVIVRQDSFRVEIISTSLHHCSSLPVEVMVPGRQEGPVMSPPHPVWDLAMQIRRIFTHILVSLVPRFRIWRHIASHGIVPDGCGHSHDV